MPMFRKRPVEVEARQWHGGAEAATPLIDWILAGDATASYHDAIPGAHGESLAIRTLEGTMYADPGDWIIRGVEGEFYPCKPGIFKQTYELT